MYAFAPKPTLAPTTVIFCRHGETEGNREGRFGGHGPTPLTELGRQQARAAGRALARLGVDAIYSSDLVRAQQTAGLIGEVLGLTPQATPALRERSVGCLTGLTFDEARSRYPEVFEALLRREPESCPPGGESYVQCRQRATAFIQQTVARHAGSRLLFVSHQVTLLQLMEDMVASAGDTAETRPALKVDHCALHRFEQGAGGAWQVVALNERVAVVDGL